MFQVGLSQHTRLTPGRMAALGLRDGVQAVILEPWIFFCQNLEVSQGIPVIKDHEPLIFVNFFQSGNTLPSLER